jgi:hypothetical protein
VTTLRAQRLIFFVCGWPGVFWQLGVCGFFEHLATGKTHKMLLIPTCLAKASSHFIVHIR